MTRLYDGTMGGDGPTLESEAKFLQAQEEKLDLTKVILFKPIHEFDNDAPCEICANMYHTSGWDRDVHGHHRVAVVNCKLDKAEPKRVKEITLNIEGRKKRFLYCKDYEENE